MRQERPPMANQDQRDELESVQAIYYGSSEVEMELAGASALGSAASGEAAGGAQLIARVTVESELGRQLELHILLPTGYLSAEHAGEPPRFLLASRHICWRRLHSLCGQLDGLLAEAAGGPVLFTWIEWIRTEPWSSPAKTDEEQEPEREEAEGAERDPRVTAWGDDAAASRECPGQNDAEEARPVSAEPPACANCAGALHDAFGTACGHALCRKCLVAVVKVQAACGAACRCPLPGCSEPLAEDAQEAARDPELWAAVARQVRGTPFEQAIVYCPRCEDRGMDIPVLVPSARPRAPDAVDASTHLCQCFQCSWQFCEICRSPWHPGSSCFDDESRVVRMAKRRPPLTDELAEAAAKVVEEVRSREAHQARQLEEILRRGAGGQRSSFEAFRHIFASAHTDQVMQSLHSVFGHGVALRPAPVAPAVHQRFMQAMLEQPEAEVRPAFHGTDVRNHVSIFERGLLVPGDADDIKVAHGQVHGRGIYTANVDAAWLSKGFCTAPNMLVCAVLQSESGVRHVGDAMVVARSDHVVPLFEGFGDSFDAPTPPSHSTLLGQIWVPGAGPKPAGGARAPGPAKIPGKPAKAAAQSKDKKSKFLTRLASRAQRH